MGTQARIGSVEIDMYKKTGIQHTLDKCCIPVYTIYFGKLAKNFRGKNKVFDFFAFFRKVFPENVKAGLPGKAALVFRKAFKAIYSKTHYPCRPGRCRDSAL